MWEPAAGALESQSESRGRGEGGRNGRGREGKTRGGGGKKRGSARQSEEMNGERSGKIGGFFDGRGKEEFDKKGRVKIGRDR